MFRHWIHSALKLRDSIYCSQQAICKWPYQCCMLYKRSFTKLFYQYALSIVSFITENNYFLTLVLFYTDTFCCMKCLQTLPWWLEKNPFVKEGANTADAKTHTPLTQYTWSHSKWWHGNTMVNPDWGPSAGFPPDSVHCPPKRSLLKFTRLQRPTREPLAIYCWFQQIYYPCGQTAFLCLHVSVYLCLRQEVCVAWRDKDAGEPHPSTNSDVNRCSARQSKNAWW